MISEIKIHCINKDRGNHHNPYLAIEKFGWSNFSSGETGKYTLKQMVDFLEKGHRAFVQNGIFSKVYLKVVQQANGDKFVQTYADGKPTNNLLNLPECRV